MSYEKTAASLILAKEDVAKEYIDEKIYGKKKQKQRRRQRSRQEGKESLPTGGGTSADDP